METKEMTKTASLLESMYKNVKMGADSIITIMPKVGDESMKSELTSQLSRLEGFAKEISDMLHGEGMKPKEDNVVTKLASKMGINMSTMMDSTTSHIAQMMMEGYTMGITDMTKDIREYENTNASEASLKLTRQIVKFHEDCFEKMKSFL